MSYCDANDIRDIAGVTTDDMNDEKITTLISYATAQLNAQINTRIVRERVSYIDGTRENDIDGANTYFYVQWWKDFYIGDLDNDGDVDISDVIVHIVDSNGTETTATVSAVDVDNGKITLSSAPASDTRVYITYSKAPFDEDTPHFLIKKACVELSAALCFMRIDKSQINRVKLGKFTIFKQPDIFQEYYNRYMETVHQINSRSAMVVKADYDISKVISR